MSRLKFVANMVGLNGAKSIAEIGVYHGELTAHLLENCDCIKSYIAIDPWRQLINWDKPYNQETPLLEGYNKVMGMAAEDSRLTIIRKETKDVDEVPDSSLDFIYIDGDHTLRGITIDLAWAKAKIKPNGVIMGDDFNPNILHHGSKYEPTMVFPYAVHFAEANNMKILTSQGQFIIYAHLPFTTSPVNTALKGQFKWYNIIKSKMK